jgi:hypothetical protein
MKHFRVSGAWRPDGRPAGRRRFGAALSALTFNVCLLVLPIASAAALFFVSRDHLYAYEYTETGARVVRDRVARLNGDLIQIDFDRQRQWDSLVAIELSVRDEAAARGFLLSAPSMLPPRTASVLAQAAASDATDPEIEVAALQLLTPNTRDIYQSQVRLLSQRAATPPEPAPVADTADFELMARALLEAPETDPMQFILAGFSLDLAGELTPRMRHGAAILLIASRRDDFAPDLREDFLDLLSQAAPMERFRESALERAGDGDAGAYANASAAFASIVNDERAGRMRSLLDHIGMMGEATSPSAATVLLTHAFSTADIPRLSLIARAAGDRAAAASKRLPRDGRLLEAARGELRFTNDLIISLGFVAFAMFGLVALVILKLVQGVRDWWRGHELHDDVEEDLIDLSSRTWRPL